MVLLGQNRFGGYHLALLGAVSFSASDDLVEGSSQMAHAAIEPLQAQRYVV